MKFKNREELFNALAESGMFLRAVEPSEQDEEMVLAALKVSLGAIQYIDKRFSNDKDFIMKAIKETPWALYIYKFANSKISAQEDIVFEAVKRDGSVVGFVGKDFSNRIDLARVALNASKKPSLQYFGNEVKDNAEFLLEVFAEHPQECRNASPRLLNDPEFLAKAVDVNEEIWKFMPSVMVDIVKDYIVTKMSEEKYDVGISDIV